MKVRFAPSPTGYLHIGSLRTLLYNYLFAKKNKGKLLLRIEDTDKQRYVNGAEKEIIKTIKTFNLNFDEKPLFQSSRLKIYKKHAEQLVKQNKAYYCFCTKQRLDKMRKQQIEQKIIPKYDRHCLNLTKQEIEQKLKNNIPHVIRLKLPDNEDIILNDEVYGKVKINTNDLDDQVLLKSDGYPTYHLAVVIDDNEMGITHVIRGEEWLPSTPKHIILYQIFGWKIPKYIHLPLLLNPNKTKLSKRQGDIAVEDFLEKGYLPEAILNYIAFLGWNPKTTKEIYSLEELIKDFSIEKINKAGAIFNIEKLNWFNAYYVRKIVKEKKEDYKNLLKQAQKFLPKDLNNEQIANIVQIFSSRINYSAELKELSNFLFKLPSYRPNMLIFKKGNKSPQLKNKCGDKDKTKKGLNLALENLQKTENGQWNEQGLNQILKQITENNNLSPGDIFWPVRLAISGLEKSPSPAEILWVLGKEESLKRIKKAINKLKE